jgi:exonuclease SbcD
MKLIHTSDLHFGALWRGRPRQDDQTRVLDEIVRCCETHDVDLLLVTGDVFADRAEGPLPGVVRHLLEQLRPLFRQRRAVFLLRGNHDQLPLFTLLRFVLDELQGQERWPLVVADLPGTYQVPLRRGGAVQVVALPYVRPGWLQSQEIDADVSPEARVAGLAGRLAMLVEAMGRQVVPSVPAIFAGHVLIGGAQLKEDLAFESGYDRELWLEPARLLQFTSYNALGHIHLRQQIASAGKPTWYAGAPDRLDLGEREYRPHVLLVTTPDTPGGAAQVESIPLTRCTPFVKRELAGQEAVDAFCAELAQRIAEGAPDPLGEAIVSDVAPGARMLVETQIRRIAPRLQVEWAFEPVAAGTAPDDFDPHDVPAAVRTYLESAFGNQPARRARLEAAFQALWSETTGGETDASGGRA